MSNITISFSNSSSKISKLSTFGRKLGHFCWRCWFQIWQYCFQILAQKYSNEAFFIPNLRIFLFSWNLSNRQIRGYWFQISQQVFKILAEKYTRRHFWDQIQAFLFFFLFCKIWQLDKFESADFKYDNIFFKV